MSAQLKGPYWEKGILSTETWTFGRTPTQPGPDPIYLIPTLFWSFKIDFVAQISHLDHLPNAFVILFLPLCL